MYETKDDGETHINIYSKGRTQLGRMLSNFAALPTQTEDGPFTSIEGYWYWLKIGGHGLAKEVLRDLSGAKAKAVGRKIVSSGTRDTPIDSVFQNKIERALRMKIRTYPFLNKLLVESSLPFTHYYVYGDKQINAGHKWILDIWEKIRKELKDECI